MSDQTGPGLRLVTLPVSPRPVGAAPAMAARPGRRGNRWTRRGWPLVELLGVAALILGLVSVLAGGDGGRGGLPAILTDLGGTTRQATPTIDPDAVAMAQGDAGRTGELPGPGVEGVPERLWRLQFPIDPTDRPWSSIGSGSGVVSAGGLTLFVEREINDPYARAGQAGQATLRVVDASDGTERWRTTISGTFQGQPLLSDGLVIVAVDLFQTSSVADGPSATPRSDGDAAQPGLVLAFDALTGAERWRTAVGSVGTQDPIFQDGVVYLIDNGGHPLGLDVASGETVWRGATIPPTGTDPYGPTSAAFSSVAVADGRLVVSSLSGFSYAYDLDDEAAVWTWPDPTTVDATQLSSGHFVGIAPVIRAGQVYLPAAGSNGQTALVAVALSDGAERWRHDFGLSGDAPLVASADGIVIVVTSTYPGSSVAALSPVDGTVQWTISTALRVTQLPTVVGDQVYLGGEDGTVSAHALLDGSQTWRVRAGDAISSAVYASDGIAFFASYDGYVYAIGGSGPATVADGAAGTTIDVSGLPACGVTPRDSMPADPGAAPASTLPGVDAEDDQTVRPTIRWSDLPAGVAPSPEQADAISRTLTMMQACARPGNGAAVAAFYTDDYFARPSTLVQTAYDGFAGFSAVTGLSTSADVVAYGRVLPDGRVALIEYSANGDGTARVTVLAEQPDGRWLIDEVVGVSVSGRSLQG